MISNLTWTLGQGERVVRFDLPPAADTLVSMDAPHVVLPVVLPVEPRPVVRIPAECLSSAAKPGRKRGMRMPAQPGSAWSDILGVLGQAKRPLSLAQIVEATGRDYTLVSVTLSYRVKRYDVARIGRPRDYHYQLPEAK
jgi:hypothetical protein